MQEVKNYRVFGLCRSGNHAVIGWLINKFDNRVVHNNNIIFNPNKNKFIPTEPPRVNQSHVKDLGAIISSFEDYDMEKYFNSFEQKLPVIPHENIFIVRDPFNLFASRNKKAQEVNHRRLYVTPNVVKIWKIMVKEAYGETNLTDNKKVINFNGWATDKDYRIQVSKDLGLPVDKDNTSVMSNDGKGSSFDGFKYRNNPQEMKLLSRWKYFENDKTFMSIFDDEELVELSKKYFKE